MVSMAKITLNMVGEQFRLRLLELEFTSEGSTSGAINRIRFFHSPDGNFDNAYPIGSLDAANNTTHIMTFDPGRILQDGENVFYVFYEIHKPTASNALNCGNPLSFNLVRFDVGERENIPDKRYVNYTLFSTITKQIFYNRVEISNYDNGHGRLNKEYHICLNEGDTQITLSVTGDAHGGAIAGTYYGYE